MRLAQIARKVQTKPAEIRSFIKNKFDVELESDPNIKLDDKQVKAILEEFKVEGVVEEKVEEVVVEKVIEEEEDEVDPTVDTDISSLKELAEETIAKVAIPEIEKPLDEAKEVPEEFQEEKSKAKKKQAKKKSVEIVHADPESTDEAAEEDPSSFDEVAVDEDAELIAAKVEKLDGLKVVGKIDLTGPPPEEEELPTAEAIEEEIDQLDDGVDTSGFTDLTEENPDDEKDALFAELDAQMDGTTIDKEVKPVGNAAAAEVKENISEEEEEEYSVYKDDRGEYHFSAEQKANRINSIAVKKEKAKIQAQKAKKARHYQENVASKSSIKPKKKKSQAAVAKAKKQEVKQAPKGPWKRFLRWLND
jgi:hypothetical protein